MTRRIIVVGAGLAGLRATEQIRAHGWSEAITVLGSEAHPPYNRPPLTKTALVRGVDLAQLAFRQRPSTADVDWRLGTTVVSADLAARQVTLADGSTEAYDGLVVATGVSARRLGLGAPLSWRRTVRVAEDAMALRSRLTDGARVVIIGAGFIGCEVAAAAVERGCRVTVVEPLATPLQGPIGRLVGAEVQRRHEAQGVRFHLGRTVTGIDGVGDRPTGVSLDDGTCIPCDVVVEAVGSAANTGWLEGNGLDLDNGVLCDANLHPVPGTRALADVVALGDVARHPIPLFGGTSFRIEHWSAPGDTAAHAARSLLTGLGEATDDTPVFDPVPSFWSDQFGVRLQSYGLPHLGTDDVRVLEGDLSDQAVVGFHDAGRMVGVVLFGMAPRRLHYRTALVEAARAGSAAS